MGNQHEEKNVGRSTLEETKRLPRRGVRDCVASPKPGRVASDGRTKVGGNPDKTGWFR
jgi:hypothetical protein